MARQLLLASVALALAPAAAWSAVADSGTNGFTVKIAVPIAAAPDAVYRKLVQKVGDWWNSDHTFSLNAHNLSIEEKPMGCFCEKWPGGGVRHMEVLYVDPGKVLVLSGGLGPLQSMAVTGSMTIQFSPKPGGTALELTYAVSGYVPAGVTTWSMPVDGMLTEQVTRLKNYIEHGNPAK